MHSRVFQISENPIDDLDLFTYGQYDEHWFLNEYADYTDPLTSDAAITESLTLLGMRQGIVVDITAKTMVVHSKNAVLADDYAEVIKCARHLTEMTLDQFAQQGGGESGPWREALNEAWSDTAGLWFDDGYEKFGMVTFNDFIRKCTEGKTYYIGTIFDYHC